MKLKNLVVFFAIAIAFGSCRSGRVSITAPSSQTVLNNFIAFSNTVDSFTTASSPSVMIPYVDKAQGYAALELTMSNYMALDSLRPNHKQIVNTDLIIQKHIIQFEGEHEKAISINGAKLKLSGIFIKALIKNRIIQEQSLFNVKQ